MKPNTKFTITRTNSENADFLLLVKKLDNYLSVVDGEQHAFYHQYNKVELLNNVVVAYDGVEPVACGAFKTITDDAVEIKRMYTEISHRGMGMATLVLDALEYWAKELGYAHAVLETGRTMSDAIGLYTNRSYIVIPNYGPYTGVANSICFKKLLV